ncbi:MAG: hypothetical protein OXF79_02710 [Chloroflexi bacterium]|nr:hypothetical protein [Chloroflexota bacterium]
MTAGIFTTMPSSSGAGRRAFSSSAVPGPLRCAELSRRGQPGADAGGGMARFIHRRATMRWAPPAPGSSLSRDMSLVIRVLRCMRSQGVGWADAPDLLSEHDEARRPLRAPQGAIPVVD